jgi:hypothetical protein
MDWKAPMEVKSRGAGMDGEMKKSGEGERWVISSDSREPRRLLHASEDRRDSNQVDSKTC